jgi:hypothetical protein
LRDDLAKFLLRLALNYDPPDLHLLRSWDYRCESPLPAVGSYYYHDRFHYYCTTAWDEIHRS